MPCRGPWCGVVDVGRRPAGKADISRIGLRSRRTDPCARSLRFPRELIGFPRHLSQHVGGFVHHPRTVARRDGAGRQCRDGGSHLPSSGTRMTSTRSNMLKVDILALGMLSCIRRAFDFIEKALWAAADPRHHAARGPGRLSTCCAAADSLGVFQVESRAQMNMLPRFKPRNYLRPRHRGGDCAAGADPG